MNASDIKGVIYEVDLSLGPFVSRTVGLWVGRGLGDVGYSRASELAAFLSPKEEMAGEGGRRGPGAWTQPTAAGCLHACFFSGPSGSGRPRWAWSCWRRRGTTRPCRGCFRRLISTTQACWAAWTAPRPPRPPQPCIAACTGLLPRPTPSCSGPLCPACSSTAWDPGDSRPSIPCPTPSQAPRTPGEEPATDSAAVPSLSPPQPDSCPFSSRSRPRGRGPSRKRPREAEK